MIQFSWSYMQPDLTPSSINLYNDYNTYVEQNNGLNPSGPVAPPPSSPPTNQPSNLPTGQPSNLPTSQPSNLPTSQPSNLPTNQPSNLPTTSSPSKNPTANPTDSGLIGAPPSVIQTTHIIDEFTSNNNYYSAFNNGSGSLSTSIDRGDFASGSSSLEINYSFNAGANFFFSSIRNYGTTAQDYSYLTTAFSVTHKGGHADDQIAIRLWEDINGNGAFDGEDEVYQSATAAIGTNDWTTSTFDLNSFTKVVGAGNGQIDLNRIRAWDIKISNSSSSAHNGKVLVDKFSLESSYTAPITGSAKLNGAFIQLWNTAGCKCGEWTQAQWDAEFQEMKDVQLDYLVVQYSVYHDLSWYSPSSISTVIYKMNTLNRIVAAAEKAGMRVHFGLYFDETWNSADKATSSTYTSVLTKHKLVIDELWDLFGASSAFGGWYIPQELNDLEWQDDPEKSLLFQWMKDVTDYTKTKSTTKPAMIAPFFNLWQSADQLEAWYDELLTHATNLDRVYPQDGVGITLKDPEYHTPLYYSAIKRACDKNGRTFGATIETFHQTSGWPVDSGSFSATSTEIATLKKQLWNAARQQPDEMIQFSWSYMQPNLTSSSTNLYNNYKAYVEQNNSLNPTRFPTPGPTTPVTTCTDDKEWIFIDMKGRSKNCDWVRRKPNKRCEGKYGLDGWGNMAEGKDACPLSCNPD